MHAGHALTFAALVAWGVAEAAADEAKPPAGDG